MKRRLRTAAFTLVEVLTAMIVISAIIPVIVSLMTGSTDATEVAERMTIAGQLAENQLSQILIDQSNTIGTGSSGESGSSGDRGEFTGDYQGYRWEMHQEAWIVSPETTQYTVEVFYTVKGRERSVSVSTLVSTSQTTP